MLYTSKSGRKLPAPVTRIPRHPWKSSHVLSTSEHVPNEEKGKRVRKISGHLRTPSALSPRSAALSPGSSVRSKVHSLPRAQGMALLGIDFTCALESLRDGRAPDRDDCVLPLLSKLVGYCLIAASTTVKLPQVCLVAFFLVVMKNENPHGVSFVVIGNEHRAVLFPWFARAIQRKERIFLRMVWLWHFPTWWEL